MEYWGETMEHCFSKLEERIFDAVNGTDLCVLFEELKKINAPTLVTGVGGSGVVSAYFSKVIRAKNRVICTEAMPRDLLYMPLDGYENVVSCSYSGKNIGVSASFRNGMKKYLFSGNKMEGITTLQYLVPDEEQSFVSVAGTLIPMALLFLYYTDGDIGLLREIIHTDSDRQYLPTSDVVEILYGYEQSTAAKLLESSLTEGGLAAPVLHEKYNYCHGRCKLNDAQNNDLIYFPSDNELDDLLRSELPDFYGSVTVMESRYTDQVINDFYLSYQAMLLCRAVAEVKEKDISKKIVPEISEKLYLYDGTM